MTIHDPYFKVDAAKYPADFTFSQTAAVLYAGYLPYIRMFIPPGTIVMDLMIQEAGKQTAVAHHNTLPAGMPESSPTGYPLGNKYKLSQLESGDQWATETLQGDLYISHDSFLSPYLPTSRAGWLYVKVGGGSYSQSYFTMFTVQVDTKTYNDWFDHYGSNPDGSINWQKDVESVMTYTAPTKPINSTSVNMSTTNNNKNCQLDDPDCAKTRCKDVQCFDGCNKQWGLLDCKGRE